MNADSRYRAAIDRYLRRHSYSVKRAFRDLPGVVRDNLEILDSRESNGKRAANPDLRAAAVVQRLASGLTDQGIPSVQG